MRIASFKALLGADRIASFKALLGANTFIFKAGGEPVIFIFLDFISFSLILVSKSYTNAYTDFRISSF